MFPFRSVRQSLRPGVIAIFIIQLFEEVLLPAGQFAGIAPHPAQIIGELTGVLLAHLFAELLKLLLRARSGGERLRSRALAGGLSSTLNVFASLVELPPLIGHARLVFGPVHALAQLVHVREHLLFFLLEALEAAAEVFALVLGARFLQRGLQFFEPIIGVLLAAGQFLQSIHHLQVLAELVVLRPLCLALRFIPVLGLRQVHLLELALHALVHAAPLIAAVAVAHDRVFVFLQLQQGLVGRLFGGQGFRQGRR